jgi:hypothetical protein
MLALPALFPDHRSAPQIKLRFEVNGPADTFANHLFQRFDMFLVDALRGTHANAYQRRGTDEYRDIAQPNL